MSESHANEDEVTLRKLQETFGARFAADRGSPLEDRVWRFRSLLFFGTRSFDVRLYRWISIEDHTEICIHEQLYGSAVDMRVVEQVVAASPLACVPLLKTYLDELTR